MKAALVAGRSAHHPNITCHVTGGKVRPWVHALARAVTDSTGMYVRLGVGRWRVPHGMSHGTVVVRPSVVG